MSNMNNNMNSLNNWLPPAEDVMSGCFHPKMSPMPNIRNYAFTSTFGFQRWVRRVKVWTEAHPAFVWRPYLHDLAQYQLKCAHDPTMVPLKYVNHDDPEWKDVLPGYPKYPLIHHEEPMMANLMKNPAFVQAIQGNQAAQTDQAIQGNQAEQAEQPVQADQSNQDLLVQELTNQASATTTSVEPSLDEAAQGTIELIENAANEMHQAAKLLTLFSAETSSSAGMSKTGTQKQQSSATLARPKSSDSSPSHVDSEHAPKEQDDVISKRSIQAGKFHPDGKMMPNRPIGRPTKQTSMDYARVKERWIMDHPPRIRRYVRECVAD